MKEELAKALNEQLNFEFYSAHVYLAMAAYCSGESLDGFANFFLIQAEEERFHAMKIYRFLNDRGLRATLAALPEPKNDYSSVLDAFEHGYAHEQQNTGKFYNLTDLALETREHATMYFLKWFVDEQVEEESLFSTIIEKLKRIDKDSNAFYMMDAEFAARTFTPPAE
ncbi:Ferritin [compost metagenome]|uniref:Ferritin n=1 Tax=Paenibacillus stellifer TaxID=169760 RepID=A0A089LUV7_9BACL|nr:MULTISPECIES: ferritin [Paenibacillus]AIQ64707.1 ferritin [Paenibacillus stellifer]MBY9081561.1 ferritin [Paenibacillus sp. CGMCC 1.18879]MBY9087684.1 ferritin [Paenibacillus sinensis]